MVSPASRRELVDWAKHGFQLSERPGMQRRVGRTSMIRYASVSAPDAPLRARLHELARDRLTFGYPRLHVLLKREGWTVNRKRVTGSTARRDCRSRASGLVVARPPCSDRCG